MDKKSLISKPIAQELEKFNSLFRESVFSDNIRIQSVIDYIMKSDGKRIRPTLLLLAAKACGQINDTAYLSAVTIELLHTASLIHDDVVDESLLRRGNPSVNAVYDNKVAVLAGDYFLSTALIKSVMTSNLEIISSVSMLGRNLAEGELNQLSLAKEVILDENEYFNVIKEKTASLLSTCMKIGAISAGGDEESIKDFTCLGENLGICFQLRDDIFDYFKNDVGKPTGNDIREGKVTLPLLYALKTSTNSKKVDFLVDVLKKADFTDENVEILIDFALENGGIDYAYSKIDEYKAKAQVFIEKIENKEVKEALTNAVEYIVERAY
ncbi:octaprenyl-diphosphate synthase [Dysgonomonas sp. PH5-45]|uniref:polyprenyl synthetase family protein n=1 Tax=unclassified Dysgonomonas TaxID=2630389 RepID=UPI002476DD07|nr:MULTISPECIES: polyprenyl synthetase family protein [unclassified Dysgonomonas]MDH6353711.1 octaprenyl-diphosphate synthase [Dysgonomonas sp. PH5-45]MDH6386614.1 octaprenyl-diphosphate synthase [Dysgonomonas sp. PH5-37]